MYYCMCKDIYTWVFIYAALFRNKFLQLWPFQDVWAQEAVQLQGLFVWQNDTTFEWHVYPNRQTQPLWSQVYKNINLVLS